MEVRKLNEVLGSQVGKIIDFIIRGFLLMLRLRNNGMANKQLYVPYILKYFFVKLCQSFACNGLMYPLSTKKKVFMSIFHLLSVW